MKVYKLIVEDDIFAEYMELIPNINKLIQEELQHTCERIECGVGIFEDTLISGAMRGEFSITRYDYISLK